jgi:hypothetical protein
VSNTKNLGATIWAMHGGGEAKGGCGSGTHEPITRASERAIVGGQTRDWAIWHPSTRCQMLWHAFGSVALVWTFGRLVFAAKKEAC